MIVVRWTVKAWVIFLAKPRLILEAVRWGMGWVMKIELKLGLEWMEVWRQPEIFGGKVCVPIGV